MTVKEDAAVMLESIEHPERFCQICCKRVEICTCTKRHITKKGEDFIKDTFNPYLNSVFNKEA